MRRSSSAVVLFTLTPEAEGVRKPLGLHGSQRATALFATLIEHVQTVCTGLSGADLLVASEAPVDLPARAQWLRQRGRDFGESLRLAVEEAFARGYRRVVVIGNDAGDLSGLRENRSRRALTRRTKGRRRSGDRWRLQPYRPDGAVLRGLRNDALGLGRGCATDRGAASGKRLRGGRIFASSKTSIALRSSCAF